MGSASKREPKSILKTVQEAAQNQERETRQDSAEETVWEQDGETKRRNGHRREKYRLTGSQAAKICVFFLLAIVTYVATAGLCACVYIGEYGFYTESRNNLLVNILRGNCVRVAYSVMATLEVNAGNTKEAEKICERQNVEIELIRFDEERKETIVWRSAGAGNSELTTDVSVALTSTITVNGYRLSADDSVYLCRVYIDPGFPLDDEFQQIGRRVTEVYEIRYLLLAVTAGAAFLCLLSFIFLMCSSGHHNGKKGIVPGVLTDIPLDVLTVLFLGLGLVHIFALACLKREFSYSSQNELLVVGVLVLGITLLAVWVTLYCMDLALRLKLGKFWRNTLIFRVSRRLWRLLRLIGRSISFFVQGLPMIWRTILIFAGVCFLEFLAVAWFWGWRKETFLLWALEKAAFLPIILYAVLTFKELLKASHALAQGQEDYTVDTSWMFGEFKAYGENLNSLGQGISKAVAERMKSERLKTELISNVSHDLKTPLTSIINYADLLCEEINGSGVSVDGAALDREKTAEYAEVLLRQSRRLKKLLEDLLEASKATTGNLEVNLEPCEVGVLFSQTVGEYQQKMEQGGLELLIRQPEKPVKIMADGRRLWRVFDNLLNNICKYAQENTRVYLSLQAKDGQVQIIFRNISKYPLDISGEELEERFVRGDKSRHMEGNGLGLSIAKSLVELQNGRMEIVIDGDLFKVTLGFPEI